MIPDSDHLGFTGLNVHIPECLIGKRLENRYAKRTTQRIVTLAFPFVKLAILKILYIGKL